MMRRITDLGLVLTSLCALSWIDYGDAVEREAPAFGKGYLGFQLKVFTEKVEFEQETPELVTVVLRNDTDRGSLLPASRATADRRYALYLVLADRDGNSSLFSPDLFPLAAPALRKQALATHAETELLSVPFDSLEMARVTEYRDGMPYRGPGHALQKAGTLVPKIYTLKAVLLSNTDGKRPDFVVGSAVWRVMLLPKSAARMTEAELQAKMRRYLAKMTEGAYGGIAVSSQLSALGAPAVDPLIALAEKTGTGLAKEPAERVRESRHARPNVLPHV